MDCLSTVLDIYKEEVASVAIMVGIIKSLTGLTTSYQILVDRDTTKQSAVGSVSSLSLAVLGVKHATLNDDKSLICTHILQIVVDIINLLVYFYHTNHKWRDVIEPLGKGCCLVLAGFGYAQLEDPTKVCMRFGSCLGALSVVTLASPFTKLKKMMKENNRVTINLIITLLSMVASILWVLVALTVNNPAMLVQNMFGFLLNAIHVAIYFLYHK